MRTIGYGVCQFSKPKAEIKAYILVIELGKIFKGLCVVFQIPKKCTVLTITNKIRFKNPQEIGF